MKMAKITETVAKIMRTLGHPSRVEILMLLSESKAKPYSVTEIHERLGMNQPETSKHLKVMRSRFILNCEKKNGRSLYKINAENPFITAIINYLNHK